MTMNYNAADLEPAVIDHTSDSSWCPANGEGKHCDCCWAKGNGCHWCAQVTEENIEAAEKETTDDEISD